jgi:hypothetical protein
VLYFPLNAFQRILSTPPNIRMPSCDRLMSVPSPWDQATGTSSMLSRSFLARYSKSGWNP